MTTTIDNLDALYRAFDGLSMEGGWHRRTPALWPEPRNNFLPAIWRYSDVKPILAAAGELVSTEFAERRNLTMTNPLEGNIYPTVRTLVAAYQMIRPGERAKAHRHTANALRLILDGHGTYTTVDGQRLEMRPGDVLLTPNWAWHSHENVGQEDCYWLDFLDVPLVHLLEPMFFEHHPDGVEKTFEDVADSPFAFRREDIEKGLAAAAPQADGRCAREVQLGPANLATIDLAVQRYAAGQSYRTIRTTANCLFAVIDGRGTSVIDGRTMNWSRGDVLAVPAWRPFSHEAAADATMLCVSDKPVLDALGFLRIEYC